MSTKISRPKSVKIHADSPTEAMWTYYRTLESRDAAQRVLGAAAPDENFLAARDTIRQARAYFSAARSSPLLTRPVLAYYGMVSLAKLVLLLHPDRPRTLGEIEEVERRGHGLKQHDATDANGDFLFGECEIEITCDGKPGALKARGMFPVLAEAVIGPTSFRLLGARCTITDLFGSIPQLEALLRHTMNGCTYRGAAAEHLTHQDGSVDVLVDLAWPDLATLDDLKTRAPYLEEMGATFTLKDEGRGRGPQAAIRFADSLDAFRVAVREEYATKAAAIPPALAGARLESILASYMLMYGLSVVARYKPHRWAAILEGQTPFLPAIEAFVASAERWWPNLLLNRLTGSWISFPQPSYW